jgi:hypothetical protein
MCAWRRSGAPSTKSQRAADEKRLKEIERRQQGAMVSQPRAVIQ